MRPIKHKNSSFSPRILLIEPEENIIEFLRLGLSYEGYQVESTQSGLEGLEAARRIQPRLIILELALPDIAGLELCRRLHGETTLQVLPLLVMAELKISQIQMQAREAGASAFVIKPFSFDQLLEQVTFLVPQPRTLRPSSIWGHDLLEKGFPPEWGSQDKRPLDD